MNMAMHSAWNRISLSLPSGRVTLPQAGDRSLLRHLSNAHAIDGGM